MKETDFKPLIGITPGFSGPSPTRDFCRASDVIFCDMNYVRSIERTGGIPVVLAHVTNREYLEQITATMDGLLLTGGDDVHPSFYNQELIDTGNPLAPERDDFEIPLTKMYLTTGEPILAICRGIQLVNVVLGGTLVQDIPTQVGSTHHVQVEPSAQPTHQVQLDDQCRLARVFHGQVVDVNSHHHQALDNVAPGLRVVGRSEEGIVEVVEHERHPYVVGVQWHPERLGQFMHQELFNDFIQSCRENRVDR